MDVWEKRQEHVEGQERQEEKHEKDAGPTGTVNVGLSAGTIAIGNGAVNNTVIIGNTGAGLTGTVNIGIGSNAINIGSTAATVVLNGLIDMSAGPTGAGNIALATNVMNIGRNTTTLTIGNTATAAYGTLNLGRSSSTINIGGNVASTITIGNTASTITFPGGLAVTGANTIGLGNGTGTYGTGDLGFSIGGSTGAGTTGSAPTNTPVILLTIPLTPGMWILSGGIQFNATTEAYLSISSTAAFNVNACQTSSGAGGVFINVTRIVGHTSAVTYNLIGYTIASTGFVAGTVRFSAVRIG